MTPEILLRALEKMGFTAEGAQSVLDSWDDREGGLTIAKYGARKKGVGFNGSGARLFVTSAEPGKDFPGDDHELLFFMVVGYNVVCRLLAEAQL